MLGMTDIASLRVPELIAEVKRSRFDRADDQLNDLQHALERGERPEKLLDRKSTRLNSSHSTLSRMPSSA